MAGVDYSDAIAGDLFTKFKSAPRLGKIGEVDVNKVSSDTKWNRQLVGWYKSYMVILNLTTTTDPMSLKPESDSRYLKAELIMIDNFGFDENTVYRKVLSLPGSHVNDVDLFVDATAGVAIVLSDKGANVNVLSLQPSNSLFGSVKKTISLKYSAPNMDKLLSLVRTRSDNDANHDYFTIPYRTRPKLFSSGGNRFIYFSLYQFIVKIDLGSYTATVDLMAPWNIAACQAVPSGSSYYYYFSIEPYRYTEDVSNYVVDSTNGWTRIDKKSFNSQFKWSGPDATSPGAIKDPDISRVYATQSEFEVNLRRGLSTGIKNARDISNRGYILNTISLPEDPYTDGDKSSAIVFRNIFKESRNIESKPESNLPKNKFVDRPDFIIDGNWLFEGKNTFFTYTEWVPADSTHNQEKEHNKPVTSEYKDDEDSTHGEFNHPLYERILSGNLHLNDGDTGSYDFNDVKWILPADAFKDDYELQVINEMGYDDTNKMLYFALFNGFIYRKRVSSDGSGNLPYTKGVSGTTLFEPIVNGRGSFEQILYSAGMVVAMQDTNEITIWNDNTEKVERLLQEGEPLSMAVSPSLIAVYDNNMHINVYKAKDLPSFDIDYAIVEKDGNLDTYKSMKWYLNIHTSIKHQDLNDTTNGANFDPYKVTMWFRQYPDLVMSNFPGTNIQKNLYMELKDIDDIMHEKSLFLSNSPIYYKIDAPDGSSFTNMNAKQVDDKLLNIPKLWIKDAYLYNNRLYFRVRYLLDEDYVLVLQTPVTRKAAVIINDTSGSAWNTFMTNIDTVDRKLIAPSSEDPSFFHIGKESPDRNQMVTDYLWFSLPLSDADINDLYNAPDVKGYADSLPGEITEVSQRINLNLFTSSNNDIAINLLDVSGSLLVDNNEEDILHQGRHGGPKFPAISFAQPEDIPSENVMAIERTIGNAPAKTKFLTHDGEIHNMEKLYLQDLEHGNKDHFIQYLGNQVFEYDDIDPSSVTINKSEYIGDDINDELEWGYYDFSKPYSNQNTKDNSIISDVYINGKHLYRSAYRQLDDFQGNLATFVPVRRVKDVLDTNDTNADDTLKSSNQVTLVGYKRHLYSNERTVAEFTIDNTFENQTDMISTVGLSFKHDIDKSLGIGDLRVYVLKQDTGFYYRINPKHFRLEFDNDYNYVRIFIYGIAWLTSGCKIRLVTSK